MSLPNDFLNSLCCPKRSCRGDLIEKQKDNQSFLVCQVCQDEYPIKFGIPILFPNANHSPDIHHRHWDLPKNAQSYASKYNAYLKSYGSNSIP